MRTFLIFLLLAAAFAAGILASPKMASMNWSGMPSIDKLAAVKEIDYWANRYQTFLGVLVAVIVAYFTVSAMGTQNSIAERQFLAGQMQALTGDRATLQFVIAQLKEFSFQKRLFENNIAFLDTEGDKITGWQNGGNLIRTAFSNVENFRSLVAANTSKFLGLTGARTDLISKLDAIIDSQDKVRETFMGWANLNRQSNADPAAPEPPQRVEFFRTKAQIIELFDLAAPAVAAAVTELFKKVEQAEKDVAALQKVIDSKSLD